MRIALVVASVSMALSASAQAPPELGPGTRVRVAYPAGAGPDGRDVYTGVLRSLGDTLEVATDAGLLLRPRADDLAGLEVSLGRRPFPHGLLVLGVAAGIGGGYVLASSLPLRQDCHPRFPSRHCGEPYRTGEYYIVFGAGIVIGIAATTYAAVKIDAERWVPAGELRASPGGVSWRLGL